MKDEIWFDLSETPENQVVLPAGCFPLRAMSWSCDSLSEGIMETILVYLIEAETAEGVVVAAAFVAPGVSESVILVGNEPIGSLGEKMEKEGIVIPETRKSVPLNRVVVASC
jgi:hypothetical protein